MFLNNVTMNSAFVDTLVDFYVFNTKTLVPDNIKNKILDLVNEYKDKLILTDPINFNRTLIFYYDILNKLNFSRIEAPTQYQHAYKKAVLCLDNLYSVQIDTNAGTKFQWKYVRKLGSAINEITSTGAIKNIRRIKIYSFNCDALSYYGEYTVDSPLSMQIQVIFDEFNHINSIVEPGKSETTFVCQAANNPLVEHTGTHGTNTELYLNSIEFPNLLGSLDTLTMSFRVGDHNVNFPKLRHKAELAYDISDYDDLYVFISDTVPNNFTLNKYDVASSFVASDVNLHNMPYDPNNPSTNPIADYFNQNSVTVEYEITQTDLDILVTLRVNLDCLFNIEGYTDDEITDMVIAYVDFVNGHSDDIPIECTLNAWRSFIQLEVEYLDDELPSYLNKQSENTYLSEFNSKVANNVAYNLNNNSTRMHQNESKRATTSTKVIEQNERKAFSIGQSFDTIEQEFEQRVTDNLLTYKRIQLILDSVYCSTRTDTELTWNITDIRNLSNAVLYNLTDKNRKIIGMKLSNFHINYNFANCTEQYTITIKEFITDSIYNRQERYHFSGRVRDGVDSAFNIQDNTILIANKAEYEYSGDTRRYDNNTDANEGIYWFYEPTTIPTSITMSIGKPTDKIKIPVSKSTIIEYEYESFYDADLDESMSYIIINDDPNVTFWDETRWFVNIARIYVTKFETTDDISNKDLILKMTRPEGWLVKSNADNQKQLIFYDNTEDGILYEKFYPLVGDLVNTEVLLDNNRIISTLEFLYEDKIYEPKFTTFFAQFVCNLVSMQYGRQLTEFEMIHINDKVNQITTINSRVIENLQQNLNNAIILTDLRNNSLYNLDSMIALKKVRVGLDSFNRKNYTKYEPFSSMSWSKTTTPYTTSTSDSEIVNNFGSLKIPKGCYYMPVDDMHFITKMRISNFVMLRTYDVNSKIGYVTTLIDELSQQSIVNNNVSRYHFLTKVERTDIPNNNVTLQIEGNVDEYVFTKPVPASNIDTITMSLSYNGGIPLQIQPDYLSNLKFLNQTGDKLYFDLTNEYKTADLIVGYIINLYNFDLPGINTTIRDYIRNTPLFLYVNYDSSEAIIEVIIDLPSYLSDLIIGDYSADNYVFDALVISNRINVALEFTYY